tara:strand:+ start:216 stop:863 length:648 start_codon:yes stop_codon:yes gene_type:complete
MAVKRYNFKKTVYESKKAREVLDKEFTEFLPRKRNIQEFFELYSTNFYKILKSTHKYFRTQSLKYLKEWINPRTITKKGLEKQLSEIQRDIDGIEKHHPIIPNGSVISPNPELEWEFLNEIDMYYMQSGILRPILGEGGDNSNESLLNKIKEFRKKTFIPIKGFIIGVDEDVINDIKKGKPIKTEQDIFDSNHAINTYNNTPTVIAAANVNIERN